MESNITKYQKDIESLSQRGRLLLFGLYNELGKEYKIPENMPEKERTLFKSLTFLDKYNSWYNEALIVVKQLMPERLIDFISYYKIEKRKDIDYETYTISDYLINLRVTQGARVLVDTSSVLNKYTQQYYIVESLKDRFSSSLYNIKQLLQADLFDSEIDAARELCKKGFYRAAGAICGVVIEKHLSEVCVQREIKSNKKNPAINDYNQLLKDNDVIDIQTWRFIQRLGDLRNLCDHNKKEEPTKENINDLIDGIDKIIKTVY